MICIWSFWTVFDDGLYTDVRVGLVTVGNGEQVKGIRFCA